MKETRNCEICGTQYTQWRVTQRFCSRQCNGKNLLGTQRKEGVERRMTQAPEGHPIAPVGSGRVAVARLVLFDKIGDGNHPCNWCGREVGWHAGHYADENLIADHLDHDPANDTPENLVPSCLACNAHRRKNGKSNRIVDGETTVVRSGTRTRAEKRNCTFCGEEFLTPPAVDKRFCSHSCSSKWTWAWRNHRA